ncbi:MAG: acetyl-CoA carboxylase biotin carboxyl carrier protein [Planctomycetota bacterium]|nr:acetyl-CoA carboxylase biotin carboxyl carrier protein [Planctomycetota bacterium]
MIDIRKLKELVRLMVANDLTELDLRDEQETVTLRRPGPQQAPQVVAPVQQVAAPVAAPAAAPAAPAAAPAAPAAAEEPAVDEHLTPIESPMVGTFYASPSPDKPSFVKVGDTVDAETVVCLVEAMKIFNEIKAETSGVVEKVLPASGDSVEFGEPMFLIRPS